MFHRKPRTLRERKVMVHFLNQALGRQADLVPVRQEKVESVRIQIEAGTYETPDKIDVAVETLLDEVIV